jgi:hypothetical protein
MLTVIPLSLSLSLLPRSLSLSLGGETLAAAVAVLGREDDESPVLVAAHGSMDLIVDPEERRRAGMAWNGAGERPDWFRDG